MEVLFCFAPLLMLAGWVYLLHFICWKFLLWLARERQIRKPLAFYFSGIGFLVALIVALAVLIPPLANYLDGYSRGPFGGSVGMFFVLGAACGLCLCGFSALSSRTSPKGYRNAALIRTGATRRQIWLQDIFVAIVVGGAGLTVISNLWRNVQSPAALVVLEIVNVVCSFFVIADVLRLPPFPSNARRRAAFLAVTMLLALIPGIWLIEALAWTATTDVLGLLEAERKD